MTMMNMMSTYIDGLKDCLETKEVFRGALDWQERSLSNKNEYIKR